MFEWLKKKKAPEAEIDKPKKRLKRYFDSARSDRLTESFNVDLNNLNSDLCGSLSAIRGRSRNASKNKNYYRRYLNLLDNFVVGSQGIRLLSLANNNGEPDRADQKLIEKAWKKFCRKEFFEISGVLSCRMFQRSSIRSTGRDGELFVRHVRNADNEFGYCIQVIPPEFLDEKANDTLKNGNILVMGKEYTPQGKLVAYHFDKPVNTSVQPNGYINKPTQKIIYPAQDIVHFFIKDDALQVRGFPEAQQTLISLHALEDLNGSELTSYRVASNKSIYIESPVSENDEYQGDEIDEEGNIIEDLEAGIAKRLQPGETIKPFNPDHGGANHAQFSETILRSLSSGAGFSYSQITNDIKGIQPDSLRIYHNNDIEKAKTWQKDFIEEVMTPIFEEWMKMCFLKKYFNVPFGKLDKFLEHDFKGRSFPSLKPLEDAQTNKLNVEAALDSRENIHDENNRVTEDVFAELGREEDFSIKYGVPLRNQGGTTSHNLGAEVKQ